LGLDRPWFICGGWAIDLFLNRVTRAHKDVDIAIRRDDQLAFQAYLFSRNWTLQKAVTGARVHWWPGEFITLPTHAIWCKHATFQPGFFELLCNEIDDDTFRFRRDKAITQSRSRMWQLTPSGLPILAPEIVLLYKASAPYHEG